MRRKFKKKVEILNELGEVLNLCDGGEWVIPEDFRMTAPNP